MTVSTKPKRTANHSAHTFVAKREPFQGSSMYGEAYVIGSAPFITKSWLNEHETDTYRKNRPRITYIVWSFYTPIAYYVGRGKTGQWYKVGQSFSSHIGKHRSGARLYTLPGHMVVLRERRGDNTVQCFDCDTTRHFTYVKDAREAYHLHR